MTQPKNQPTERQKAFHQAVRDLAETASLVNELWESGASDEIPPDIANDEYPFEKSFDEYPHRIGAWANLIEEEISKGIKS